MRTVIVTGATGHVGRYVVDALARAGFDVVAATRSGAAPRPPFGAAPFPVRTLALDVADDAAVAVLADALVPGAAIVHLAGWHPPATAASTAADRRALIETNALGTLRVLDAARAHGALDVVVYASTFEIYGMPAQTGPVTEDDPTQPITDYGATKLAGEDHLFAFAAETGIRGVALRLPAVYGPGERVARALPNFVRRVAAGERPVVHGEGQDWGQDQRDQIHARDAARAIACALGGGATGAYNVSDGVPHSILELASTAMQVAGMEGEPDRRPAEKPPLYFHMAIDKARQALGFTPAVTLADGIAEQLAWVRAGAPD